MNLAQEYRLTQYQVLSALNEEGTVQLVRNAITGKIAVRKQVRNGQKDIYEYLQSLAHPNIPRIYECIECDECCIVIEEYIEGRTLADMLKERPFSEVESAALVMEICDTLYPLHTAEPPIVCRDLKPENIMMDAQGKVKLVDFDIARTVQSEKNRDTIILGTEGFASPEQFGHLQTDARSDIYSLGIVLNYLVTDKFPVEKMVPGVLGDIVRKCLAMNPSERYQDVKELKSALEHTFPDEIIVPDVPMMENSEHVTENVQADWRRYLPPGFRTGKWYKMVVAVIGYSFWLSVCLDIDSNVSVGKVPMPVIWIEQFLLFCTQLITISIVCNYLGWRDRISFLRDCHPLARVLFYGVIWFGLICMVTIIDVFLESLV
ncbi:MAG: serine/threonine-protein kinase [Lachnospiraceae bacterium]